LLVHRAEGVMQNRSDSISTRRPKVRRVRPRPVGLSAWSSSNVAWTP